MRREASQVRLHYLNLERSQHSQAERHLVLVISNLIIFFDQEWIFNKSHLYGWQVWFYANVSPASSGCSLNCSIDEMWFPAKWNFSFCYVKWAAFCTNSVWHAVTCGSIAVYTIQGVLLSGWLTRPHSSFLREPITKIWTKFWTKLKADTV